MTNEIHTDLDMEDQEGDIGTPLMAAEDSTAIEPMVKLQVIAEPTPDAVSDPIIQQLYQLINEFRAQQGKGALRPNGQLQQAAQYHSDYMANHNCFEHRCAGEASPRARIAATSYSASQWAENIAAGYKSAKNTVEGWKKSPGHRKHLLSDCTEMGCGYAYRTGTRFKSYWTYDVASPH